MSTVIFFIYLHYLRTTGYNTTAFDWVCLFLIGLFQIAAFFIRVGVMVSPALLKGEEGKPKRLDEWFKN